MSVRTLARSGACRIDAGFSQDHSAGAASGISGYEMASVLVPSLPNAKNAAATSA